jgi:gamma-glutamyltranspeptidase/glutathione hydrolase
MMETGAFATVYAARGLVCSVDHVASSAGLEMLHRGGSAADAAVATSTVLAVTSPHMCGMGGDLFALVQAPSTEPVALNASGRAGSGADPERLRAEGATGMPFRKDIRSVPVPGCVDGWLALHDRFGRLPLADVLAPARLQASEGFAVNGLLSAALLLVEGIPGVEDFFEDGPRRPGERCRRPGVARMLAAIVERRRDGFYGGEFGAGLLDLGSHRDAPPEFDPTDLERPLADWTTPVVVRAFGHDIWSVPPNSQGYVTLSSAWIADGLDLPAEPDDDAWVHLLVESARQAGYDRPAVLSETANGSALLVPDRLAPRRAAIDPDRVSPLRPPVRAGDTIHLCAVDADGMGVSLVQSNAADFGAHIAEPRTGIFLHNRGIGFNLQEGHPAEYRPGRRPPSTLAPALVTRPDGSLHAVVGTMGGDSQPQVVLQLLARLLHAGQPPGTAVSAPRWVLANHSTGIGFSTWADLDSLGVDVEGNAPEAWIEGLRRRGHQVRRRGTLETGFGHAHAIVTMPTGLAGMADPRAGAGAAVGY